MANGDGVSFTPAKVIGTCVAITVAINSLTLIMIQEHGAEIGALRTDLDRKTDQRYRQSDATRDLNMVNFRFERNEKNIDKCMEFIENHPHTTGQMMAEADQ